ncbi:hypothetical protein AAHE18_13G371300 [Arachis hypogaea]
MNEFLSRFMWMMRKKVRESYPNSDKETIETMLLVIIDSVAKPMVLVDEEPGGSG